MPAHNLLVANEAMESAVPQVTAAFEGMENLDVKAVQVNVVFEEGGVLWAVSSAPTDAPADVRLMLAGSLERSGEEVLEHE